MTTYGIDLGTTYSCIAYVDGSGHPTVIKNALGEDTTPSVVYFESADSVVVGRDAKNVAKLFPNLVVSLINRQIGEDLELTFHGETHTPETVSALILRDLVKSAEVAGHTVEDVVITVPAYFGIAQREATRNAGRIAGLNVLNVVPEPVAAALHYEAMGAGEDRTILVFDLGGGTFDTTVIKLAGDGIHVVCTDGDHHLGGADWDEKIADFLLASFMDENPGSAAADSEEFMQELSTVAEEIKKSLSAVRTRKHTVQFGGLVVQLELTREHLEELTSELLERTMEITERTITTARGTGVDGFDDVLLVGGMTLMPVIAQAIRERFGLNARWQDPQLAVAKGAALFAQIQQVHVKLGMPDEAESARTPDDLEQVADRLGITAEKVRVLAAKSVRTVVPRAFGLKVTDVGDPVFKTDPDKARQYIAHLLSANTPLPVEIGPETFRTVTDNQSEVVLEVWEQAGSVASEELEDNIRIGEVVLRDLPPRPAGTPLQVAFRMTDTGLLQVHGKEPGSGREVRLELRIGDLAEAQVRQAVSAVARYEVSAGLDDRSEMVRESAGRDADGLQVSETAPGERAEQMSEVPGELEATRSRGTDVGAGAMVSREGRADRTRHYLVADMPPRVAAMSDVSLLIRISADLPDRPRLSASLKGFDCRCRIYRPCRSGAP